MAPLTFDLGLEQAVDAHVAWFRWSPQARRTKRVSVTIFVFTMVAVLTYLQWRGADPDPLALAISAAVAAPIGVAYWFAYDYSVRRRTRRFLREVVGGRDPIPCEVELTAGYLRSKGGGVESTFDWTTCGEVRDQPDGVCVLFRAGPVFVPDQAFADPGARRQFIEAARRLAPRA